MNENTPMFLSIREVAKMGILPEYRLRCMEKEGNLPCIYAGKKCLINIDRLVEQLNSMSCQRTNGGMKK